MSILLTSLVPVSVDAFFALRVEEAMSGGSDPQFEAIAQGYDAAATDQERSACLVVAGKWFETNCHRYQPGSSLSPLNDHPAVLLQVAKKLSGRGSPSSFLSAGAYTSSPALPHCSSGMKLSGDRTVAKERRSYYSGWEPPWMLLEIAKVRMEDIKKEFLAEGVKHDEKDDAFLRRLIEVYRDTVELYHAMMEYADGKIATDPETRVELGQLARQLSIRTLYQLAHTVGSWTRERLGLV